MTKPAATAATPRKPAPRRPRSVARLLAAATFALALAGCAAPPADAPAIEHRTRGAGTPVVVFQSGLGDGEAVWRGVQDELAGRVASVAFSRSGYGSSPLRAGGRSPCEVAQSTRDFLRAAGIAPPYVLVGHSLGGLYQYAYAQRYPDEVAALVLLDPTHPQHWSALQREAPALAAVVKAARATAFSAAMRREFDDQAQCAGELEARRFPAVPVKLLVRERFTGLEVGAYERLAHRLEADWAARLGGVEVTRVAGTGHYLQRDRPRAVGDAIIAAVVAARAARSQ